MNLLSSTRKTLIICRSHFLVIGSCNLSVHPRFLSFQYIPCNGPTLGATVFSCAVSYVSKASRQTGEYLWKGLSLEKIQAVFELPPLINTHARTTDTNEEPYPFTHFRLISLDFVRNLKDSDHPLLWSNHVFKPLDHLKRRTAEDNTTKKGKIVTFFFFLNHWLPSIYIFLSGRHSMFAISKPNRKKCWKDVYMSSKTHLYVMNRTKKFVNILYCSCNSMFGNKE